MKLSSAMASTPLWGQSYDRNHSGVSDSESYRTSGTWIREGGDTGNAATSTADTDPGTVLTNGSHLSSDTDRTESETMTSNISGDRFGTVSDTRSAKQSDHISSIHDNPFYKSFGVRHPRSPRDPVTLASLSAKHDTDSGLGLREELGDYKPGSGFVNRLRGKFASLNVRDEVPLLPQPFHVKHTASLEDVNGDGTVGKVTVPVIASCEAETARERPRQRPALPSYGAKYRAKSVDSLNHAHRKPHIPVQLRHVERKWEPAAPPLKSPRDSHIVAPDVTLARDDIILIEKTPSHPPPADDKSDEEEEDDARSRVQVARLKEELPIDELPKPNTVSSVRSFFESSLHTEAESNGKSAKPLSPTSAQSPFEQTSGDRENRESISSPQESALTPREQVLSPREPVTTPREPILTPRDSASSTPRDSATPREPSKAGDAGKVLPSRGTDSFTRPFEYSRFDSSRYDASKSRFSWTADVRAAGSSDSSSASAPWSSALSSSSSTPSSTAASAETKSDDSIRPVSETVTPATLPVSESTRPMASPRSTAAVKAVPASRPPIPSRPTTSIPSSGTSVPPSFTPSLKKTSPVMPVAPFKDKADDDGENRYLIYSSKKKPGTKPHHAARVKDYGEVSEGIAAEPVKKKEEASEKMELENEVEKTNKLNLSHTKGRAPPVPKQRTVNASPRAVESQDRKEEMHINLSLSPRTDDAAKPGSPPVEEPKPESVVSEPVKAPAAAPRTYFSKTETEEAKPEEPAAKDSEATSEEPVRGIPSIIAQRLKQNQNAADPSQAVESRPPGELFGVRLGKTRHTDSGDDGSEIPAKRQAAAGASEQPADASSGLPAEIENQIASVRSRMHASARNKSTGVSQIFDSSQLAKKRKENQERKRAKAAVPRLDLSSITSDDPAAGGASGGYRVTPREIKPCNIEFIGANVSLGRNMLEKSRKVKINIRFHDVLVKTFEYPSEESALEDYIKEHPDEVLVLEEASGGPPESSDDSTDPLDTPRGGGGGLESELLKSNTALSHSGSLQSYKGKYQQEYELGSILNQPEKPPEPKEPETVDPESLQLRPAEEEELDSWSTSTTSDLLF